MTVQELKPYEDQTIVIHLEDGEVTTGKLVFVDFEYLDVIVDVVSTNRPNGYNAPNQAAYVFLAADIVAIHSIAETA